MQARQAGSAQALLSSHQVGATRVAVFRSLPQPLRYRLPQTCSIMSSNNETPSSPIQFRPGASWHLSQRCLELNFPILASRPGVGWLAQAREPLRAPHKARADRKGPQTNWPPSCRRTRLPLHPHSRDLALCAPLRELVQGVRGCSRVGRCAAEREAPPSLRVDAASRRLEASPRRGRRLPHLGLGHAIC